MIQLPDSIWMIHYETVAQIALVTENEQQVATDRDNFPDKRILNFTPHCHSKIGSVLTCNWTKNVFPLLLLVLSDIPKCEGGIT